VRELQLRPFRKDQLPLVAPWFADPETQRWLGGTDWPQQMLERVNKPLGEFRGAREIGRYRWLAWLDGSAVGYVDCGTYDRWTTWEGGAGGRGLTDTIVIPAGSIGYVVDPDRRRQGLGAAMIAAMMSEPELSQIGLFAAGIEPANTASVRCLLKAGFEPLNSEPDWEGIVYYVCLRAGAEGPRLGSARAQG
jgi:RimJ/RimL family protein N-acetyltransferase